MSTRIRPLTVALLVSIGIGMSAAAAVPIAATPEVAVPTSGQAAGVMFIQTRADGAETLVMPANGERGLAFRIQHLSGAFPATGYRGALNVRYNSDSVAVEFPDGRGWIFELSRATPQTSLRRSPLIPVEVRGIAAFASGSANWAPATALFEEEVCECPLNDDGCMAGGQKAKTCQYGGAGTTCSVGCDTGACCWLVTTGYVCCKCCFGGMPIPPDGQ